MSAQRWYLRFPRIVPVAIFLLVSAITALSVFAIEQVEAQRSEAQHRQVADSIAAAIERLADANAVYLRAGASLMSVSDGVTREAFREFARQLDHDDTLRSGGAMAYALVVARSQIPALEQRMRRAGIADFKVFPEPVGESALPVLVMEPDTPDNRVGVGFDVASEPVRRAAVERARLSGRPTATGAIQLIVGPQPRDRTGFAMFMPVFDGPPERHRIKAAIARGFDAQAFVDAALSPEQHQGYGVSLYDAELVTPAPLAEIGVQAAPSARIVRTILLANHRMRLEVSPPRGSSLSNLSLLTLVFGMMVAALLLVVARLVTQQAAEDRTALAWFEEQASIRNSLTRELNHRVKNTLANVLSIVALTRRRSADIDSFVAGLVGRIRALSATHDLLTQSDWGTTPIRAVIAAELAPYVQEGLEQSDRAIDIRGPHVELAPNDALSLGLAIHELATNASKYGALSRPGGRVEIHWQMMTDSLVRIEWTEQGGPPVAEHRVRGFGTELIEKIVAHELRNPVDLHFAPDGVRCSLIVPVRLPASFQIRAPRDRARAQA